MPQQPVTLKVLLGQRHWRDYGTFCAEYSKAAARCDPGRAGYPPSRAQLHRWLTGALAGLPQAAHCRVLEEMLPGWTAEQLFSPATPDLLYGGPQPSPRVAGPPVFAAPSVGIRPFVEQAFAAEHVTIDFAGFSSETLHGVIQEPLDKIRIGRLRPASLAIRILLPDTTRPMVLPCRADNLADEPAFRHRASVITARHARAITDSVRGAGRPGRAARRVGRGPRAPVHPHVQALRAQRRGCVLRVLPDHPPGRRTARREH